MHASSRHIGVSNPPRGTVLSLRCTDTNEYAHALFEFFREADRRRIETIYCEAVPEEGVGFALMDRIRRAARAE